jgi:hypothetical protein
MRDDEAMRSNFMNRVGTKKKYALLASLLAGVAIAAVFALITPSPSKSSAVVTLPLLHVDQPAIANISALHGATGLPASLPIGAGTLGDLAASQDAASAGKPSDVAVGQSELAQGRLLQTGLGTGNWSIYAYPTTAGHVCYGLADVGAGCIPGFLHGFPVSFNVVKPDLQATGKGAPVVVYGLAPDDVVSVTVNVSGDKPYTAAVTNNSYFTQLDSNDLSTSDVQSLTVAFANGSSATIANSWPGKSG